MPFTAAGFKSFTDKPCLSKHFKYSFNHYTYQVHKKAPIMAAKWQYGCQKMVWPPSDNMAAKRQYGCQVTLWLPNDSMAAKRKYCCQEKLWLPRGNIAARRNYGCQETIWLSLYMTAAKWQYYCQVIIWLPRGNMLLKDNMAAKRQYGCHDTLWLPESTCYIIICQILYCHYLKSKLNFIEIIIILFNKVFYFVYASLHLELNGNSKWIEICLVFISF